MGRGQGVFGEVGERGEGLESTDWLLQNSHGDGEESIGNIVNNIPITTSGVRWYKIYQDDHLVSYITSNHWDIHLELI